MKDWIQLINLPQIYFIIIQKWKKKENKLENVGNCPGG